MINSLKDFTNTAKDLSRNPLGIIALFIVLVYGFACLLFGFSAEHLKGLERIILIWFVVLFPVLVLFLFIWLVCKHHDKLYAPKDYRDDESFLRTLQQKHSKESQITKESEKNIEDLMRYGKGFKIIEEQEELIKKDLKSRELNCTGNTEKVLIHHLAATQVLKWFERIYYTLFGSQIFLLKFLNESLSGFTHDQVQQFFEEVKKRFSTNFSSWNVWNYLNYLSSSRLIQQKDKIILITQIGKEFLTWLAKSGYSESKYL